MGVGDSTAYRPDYPIRDAETGESLVVVWYCHRDAPSLIPWTTPSTADLPTTSPDWAVEALAQFFRERTP